MPFQEPHATYEFLKGLAASRPGSTVVFADDGEKFGTWPKTFDHVYTNGWLRHFCDMLRANRDWIETTTLARAVDTSLPLGKISLPDGSYREMTEWRLAVSRCGRIAGPSGGWRRCRTRGRSGGFSTPAATGATSRRSTRKATRCMRGCWAFRAGCFSSRPIPMPIPITWRLPDMSFIAGNATVRTGTGRLVAFICLT